MKKGTYIYILDKRSRSERERERVKSIRSGGMYKLPPCFLAFVISERGNLEVLSFPK